jgi:hypothetical protein
MFNDILFMPDLNKTYKGKVAGNRASPTYSLGWTFHKAYTFLERIHPICSDDIAMLSIIDNETDVGMVRVIKADGIQVINSFYIWPNNRGNGHFLNYMRQICHGPIKFVLRPSPHTVLTDKGEEISSHREYYDARKQLEDDSNVDRIKRTYLKMGLKTAFIANIDEEFLTNYESGDHPRIIIPE